MVRTGISEVKPRISSSCELSVSSGSEEEEEEEEEQEEEEEEASGMQSII
jgi:hypothetical protein